MATPNFKWLFPTLLSIVSACATSAGLFGNEICGDGRREVSIGSVALRYDRLGFELSAGWKGIVLKAGVKPEQLQKAEETTQNWNEFIKGVALAHNGCSGEKDRFAKLLARYDQLKRAK